MFDDILLNCEEKMEKGIAQFNSRLTTVRTGRANPNLLNRIEIDYYGTMTPINQIAAISIQEGRILVIKPFDKNSLKDIERAINLSDLNLPPQNDGTFIRLFIPKLTEETRKDYCKLVTKYAEEAKVAVRNQRREANELIKKDKTVSEDAQKANLEEIQKLTDEYIKKVDEIAAAKEKEIMTI